MQRIFDFTISLWQGIENVNFTEPKLTAQINDGLNRYNNRFVGFKVLDLIKITKGTIVLKLTIIVGSINEHVEVSRAITYFSRIMYNDLGWKELTKVAKRLFTVVESTERTISSSNELNKTVAISSATDKKTDIVVASLGDNSIKVKNIDLDLKIARLEWLYSTKKYIELEIKELELNLV
ncbi:hypothetical protein [Clostridium sp.]|uniref:hypothetical protein n=1 Tax=Clostridium sp. TaxID=1506 RepID=UPI001A510A76|nr:hypothetical protein [Clostridium sp.]MBK5234899.1 hypothetical protein [Clostridium sp.]